MARKLLILASREQFPTGSKRGLQYETQYKPRFRLNWDPVKSFEMKIRPAGFEPVTYGLKNRLSAYLRLKFPRS